ncbi:transporter [Croceicoccus estronivorus]|uniref:outer membrane protein assembly factor BamD n=1 Tax=Croceicoccus estronivorus TaxID=1172626 RepID=UPI00083145FE|nr:outer membrane protein assembly factor BamD [Croceicoccus estronivorus]OCC23108.1 transporter [Croceicoccus estronivorus]
MLTKTRTFRSPARIAILATAAASLMLTAGCGGGPRTKKGTSYVARDVETLYAAAKSRLDSGKARQAAVLFDEVERQHPYSPWARRAQMMSAFSYYVAKNYNQAIQSAQRFLSIHPGNKDAPYAYYLIALCYYEQISDVERDQKITDQALTALNEVIRRYPESQYANDAQLKVDLVRDHLAGKEMEIGRFYEKSGKMIAARIRFETVIEKYQTTSHTPEALYRLTETSLALGIPEEAKKYAAVLGANYPGTKWYERAYKLMNKYAPNATAS